MILSDSSAIRGGVVRLALGTTAGQQPFQRNVDRVIELPALAVSQEVLRRAQRRTPQPSTVEYLAGGDMGLITIEGAERRQIHSIGLV